MLVREQLVNGNIAFPVAEMGGLRKFFSGSRGTCNGCRMYLVPDKAVARQRQQGQLYGSGEASGIGYVVRLSYAFFPAFAQPVDELPSGIIPVEPEIISQIYYPA